MHDEANGALDLADTGAVANPRGRLAQRALYGPRRRGNASRCHQTYWIVRYGCPPHRAVGPSQPAKHSKPHSAGRAHSATAIFSPRTVAPCTICRRRFTGLARRTRRRLIVGETGYGQRVSGPATARSQCAPRSEHDYGQLRRHSRDT